MVRLLIAGIAIALYFADVLNATVALILLGILALTAFVRFCPLYKLFGINTHGLNKTN